MKFTVKKITTKLPDVRHIILTGLVLLCSASSAFTQSYTIAQTTTGSSRNDLRGQIFIPSEQGDGSGTILSDDTVCLTSFSVVYAAAEAPKLFIYSELPSDTVDLDNGTATGLVGESKAVSDDFPFTVYEFDSLKLDKGSTYYALFRQKVDLEFGSSGSAEGPYSGGKMVKNDGSTLAPNDFAALRFEAEFVRISPDKQDVDALIALYNATDGPNWTNTWDLDGSPYEWHGVTWEDGRVNELNLSENSLSGNIPVEMANLTNLKKLYLYSNLLSGPIPSELGNLTNLETLYISHNSLSGNIPKELGSLSNLTELFLHYNSLSGSIPAELGALTNLTSLYLLRNSLDGEIPKELGALTNLKFLYLDYNYLSGNIPVELGNLSQLQRLNFERNALTGSIPAELGNLTQLQRLDLSLNNLTGDVPVEFQNLTLLETLNFRDNLLEEMPDLSSLPLWDFEVRFNKFTFEDLEPNKDLITSGYLQLPFGQAQTYEVAEGDEQVLSFDIGGEYSSYQWTKDGENISGAKETSYTITAMAEEDAGEYQLLTTNSLFPGITLESEPVTIVFKENPEVVTGLEEKTEPKDVVIYPNPMRKIATIYVPGMEGKIADVQIFDLTGNEIPFQLNSTDNRHYTLSIASEKRGVFVIRIHREGTSVYKKIIKN